MAIEWDENKNRKNIRLHGISFEEAQRVLDDPNALELYDEGHSSEEEDRYVCIGDIGVEDCLIVFVVITDRKGNIRLISARKATQKEKEAYYENLKRSLGRN